MTTQTEKLDAATIRELLTEAEKDYEWKFFKKAWLPSLEFAATFNPHQCAALARYALELSDKVDELEQRCVDLALELAELKVRPIVDNEKKSEDLGDVMNIRFTGGK
jgi:hypothetical protein